MSRVLYSKPSITELEVEYATDAARNGWGPHCYDYIRRFEEEFAAHLGVSYAIATSSCTGSAHLGLAALGVGSGDEVIIGDINWVASAAPILYVKATPVLVDVLSDSWCLDPDAVERAISPRTKAIIAVHLYGNLCNMDRLLEIGERYSIPVIEDAAEAIGSVWRGKRAGSMGFLGTFSFHGTKTITTGEGGMVVTNDATLFERLSTLANHGRASGEPKQFWPSELGYKYKMSNLQAAVGCAQLLRVDELVRRKREIFAKYSAELKGLPLTMNPEPEGTVNGFWMPTMVADPATRFNRERLLQSFAANNIDGRVFFWPLSDTPVFPNAPKSPVAHSLYRRGVNLPSYHDMSDDDIRRVVSIVEAEFRNP